jgi:hypothetical protein
MKLWIGKRKKIIAEPLGIQTLSYWQKIFTCSPANGSRYDGEQLPTVPRSWPQDTYLARKLRAKTDR